MRALPKWVEKIHEENGDNETARLIDLFLFFFAYSKIYVDVECIDTKKKKKNINFMLFIFLVSIPFVTIRRVPSSSLAPLRKSWFMNRMREHCCKV